MSDKCLNCDSDLIERDKFFSNGTKHIEIVCPNCSQSYGFKKSAKNDDFVLMFGKHKGKKITELPDSYLDWCSKEMKSNNLRNRCIEEIERRKTF